MLATTKKLSHYTYVHISSLAFPFLQVETISCSENTVHALTTGSATVNLSWAYSGFYSTSLLMAQVV